MIHSINNIYFTGGSRTKDLKKLWENGKLPTVQYGFYGDKLTVDNVSREHLRAASKGGTKTFGNIVLASKDKNSIRGNTDISLVFNPEAARQYLKQFIGINLPKFSGVQYISLILKRLKSLGIQFEENITISR